MLTKTESARVCQRPLWIPGALLNSAADIECCSVDPGLHLRQLLPLGALYPADRPQPHPAPPTWSAVCSLHEGTHLRRLTQMTMYTCTHIWTLCVAFCYSFTDVDVIQSKNSSVNLAVLSFEDKYYLCLTFTRSSQLALPCIICWLLIINQQTCNECHNFLHCNQMKYSLCS